MVFPLSNALEKSGDKWSDRWRDETLNNWLYINESMSHLWKVLENDFYSLLILRVLNFRKVLVGEQKTEFKDTYLKHFSYDFSYDNLHFPILISGEFITVSTFVFVFFVCEIISS